MCITRTPASAIYFETLKLNESTFCGSTIGVATRLFLALSYLPLIIKIITHTHNMNKKVNKINALNKNKHTLLQKNSEQNLEQQKFASLICI